MSSEEVFNCGVSNDSIVHWLIGRSEQAPGAVTN